MLDKRGGGGGVKLHRFPMCGQSRGVSFMSTCRAASRLRRENMTWALVVSTSCLQLFGEGRVMRDVRAQLPCQTVAVAGAEESTQCGPCNDGGCTGIWTETKKYRECTRSAVGAFECKPLQYGMQLKGKWGNCKAEYNQIGLAACLAAAGVGGGAAAGACGAQCLPLVAPPAIAACLIVCTGVGASAALLAAVEACLANCLFVTSCVRESGKDVMIMDVDTFGPFTCPRRI